jgi:hypothetical protein
MEPEPTPVAPPPARIELTPTTPAPDLDFNHITDPHQMVAATAPIPAPVPKAPVAPPPIAPARPAVSVAYDVPSYDPNLPLPESPLDGFVFDELPVEGQAVLEAITHVETTNNVEAESQVLEAVEAVSHRFQTMAPEDTHDEAL